jgi:hypothetical protein
MAGPGRWVPRQADLLRLAGSAEPQRVGVAQFIQASRHVGEVIVPGTALRVTSGRMDRVGGYAVGAGACGQGSAAAEMAKMSASSTMKTAKSRTATNATGGGAEGRICKGSLSSGPGQAGPLTPMSRRSAR